jgi:hypothetical protein
MDILWQSLSSVAYSGRWVAQDVRDEADIYVVCQLQSTVIDKTFQTMWTWPLSSGVCIEQNGILAYHSMH